MLKNTEKSYGSISKIIHWLMSIMIITMLIVGFIMVNLAPSDQKWAIYNTHKATGLLILLLAVARVLWMASNIKVFLPIDLPQWQKKAAHWNHQLLYLMMFIMPLSGALMSLIGGHDISFFGLFAIKAFMHNEEISKIFWNIHVYTAFILVATVAIHFLAAMYHHFIRKDNVLIRMIK